MTGTTRHTRPATRPSVLGGAGAAIPRWPVALLVLGLAACSHGSEGDAQDNAAASTPPIHVTQTIVALKDGQPASEQLYREALARCSGGVAVTPLSDDVAGKLGRTYLDIWYEGNRMAVKADRWDFATADGAASGCRFMPVHDEQLTVVAPGKATVADLVKGTARQEPSEGVIRTAVADGGKQATGDADDEARLRAAVMAKLQQKGQGDLVNQSGGSATAAGQPCERQHSAQADSCLWSGGRRWGFVTDGSADADRMDAPTDSIPLWIKPADGNGSELTTQSMSVGAPIDDRVFALPSSVKVIHQG